MEGRDVGKGGEMVPVAPMSPYTVIRCALSAYIRPLITIFSHSVNELSFWAARRARMRATFCWGVSGCCGGGGGGGLGECKFGGFREVCDGDAEGEKVLAAVRRIEEGLL